MSAKHLPNKDTQTLVTLVLDVFESKLEARAKKNLEHAFSEQREAYEKRIECLEDSVSSFQGQISGRDEEISSLRTSMSHEVSVREHHELRVSMLAAEKKELLKRINALQKEYDDTLEACNNLETANEVLGSNLQLNKATIESLREDLERERSHCKLLGRQKDEQTEKADSLQRDLSTLEVRFRALNGEVEKLNEKISELEQLNESFVDEAARDEDIINSLHKENHTLEKALAESKSLIERSAVDFDVLKKDYDAIKNNQSILAKRFNDSESHNKSLRKENTHLRELLVALEEKIDELVIANEESIDVIHGACTQNEHLREKITFLQKQNGLLSEKVEVLEKAYTEIKEKGVQAERSNKALSVLLDEKQKKILELEESLLNKQNISDTSDVSLKELDILKCEKVFLEEKINEFKNESENYKQEAALLKDKCGQLQFSIDELQQKADYSERKLRCLEQNAGDKGESVNQYDYEKLKLEVMDLKSERESLSKARIEEQEAFVALMRKRKQEKDNHFKEIYKLHKKITELEIQLERR